MFKLIGKFIKNGSLSLMSLVFTGLIVFGGIYFYMVLRLPDVSQLKEMSKQYPLRIYTHDGKFITEFGEKKRIPITLDQVPKQLINAVLDTEDQRFYEHRGVDFVGLVRAAKAYVKSGRKSQGASTITMQVARNFFLNRQKTFGRKINEILLAFKIDNSFSKDEVLELYLNKIYFGNRAYGVAAAAHVYYGKTPKELTLAQLAMLAGLPQAPSRDNPIVNPNSARVRRNHVLQRMLENNHVTLEEYTSAISAPIVTSYHATKSEVSAPYVAEMVRSYVVGRYGEYAYDSGMKVYTTIDSRLQTLANQVLRDGLLAYDRRHGYRGPEGHLVSGDSKYWQQKLKSILVVNGLQPAAVLGSDKDLIELLLADGSKINISLVSFVWAETQLAKGDIVRVYKGSNGSWRLTQLPEIEGAIVTLNPKDGAVLALIGGFSYADSSFNRVIQAYRQPGSGFKPFIYSAALEKGFTLASIINDAPIVTFDPQTQTEWRPQNNRQNFYGPTSLRMALIRSMNLVSIRLLQAVGIPFTVDYLKKFGFKGQEAPPYLPLALGAGLVTPMKMGEAYAVFANGGYKVDPFFIETIIDADGEDVFQAKPLVAPEAAVPGENAFLAPRVISEQNAYLVTDVLKDVIKRGTGRRARVLKRNDIAGKTATTNDRNDAWFFGFNGDLVTTAWMGFDQMQTIYEESSQAVLPIWIQFMQGALKGRPEHSMEQPEGITAARIEPATGLLALPEQQNAIFELFTTDTVPQVTSEEVPVEERPFGAEEDASTTPLF